MSSNEAAMNESVWLDANRYYEAESRYYEASLYEFRKRANPGSPPAVADLAGGEAADVGSGTVLNRLQGVEKESTLMKEQISKLNVHMAEVLSKLALMETFIKAQKNRANEETQASKKNNAEEAIQNGSRISPEDDLDLFASDSDDEEAKRVKNERLKMYAAKKAKKPATIAKSSVVLDIKPWDDQTDLNAMEQAVRKIQADGLVWGASKLVPLAYGIHKLQIVAIVEDEKVSIDWLTEEITSSSIEDLIQSIDVVAFNKL